MDHSPPTPPRDLPDELVDSLDDCSSERLRDVATYADALAEHRERERRLGADDERASRDRSDGPGNSPTDVPEDRPEDVPSKATITVKEINGNRYYYWQWREGDTVTSKYRGPVIPDE